MVDALLVVAQRVAAVPEKGEPAGPVEVAVQEQRRLGADDGRGRRQVAEDASGQGRHGAGMRAQDGRDLAVDPARAEGLRATVATAATSKGLPEHPRGQRSRVGHEVVQRTAGEVGPHDPVVGGEVLADVGQDGVRRAEDPVLDQPANDVELGEEERPERLHEEEPALGGESVRSRDLGRVDAHRLLDDDVFRPASRASRACGWWWLCGVAT